MFILYLIIGLLLSYILDHNLSLSVSSPNYWIIGICYFIPVIISFYYQYKYINITKNKK